MRGHRSLVDHFALGSRVWNDLVEYFWCQINEKSYFHVKFGFRFLNQNVYFHVKIIFSCQKSKSQFSVKTSQNSVKTCFLSTCIFRVWSDIFMLKSYFYVKMSYWFLYLINQFDIKIYLELVSNSNFESNLT